MVNAKDFARRASEVENAYVASYARRRKWCRADSARWLDERSPAIMAWLRRQPGQWPNQIEQAGGWLKDRHLALVDRAHARLSAAADDTARSALHVGDIFP